MTTWRVQVVDQHEMTHDLLIDGEPTSTTTDLAAQLAAAGLSTQNLEVDGVALDSVATLGELGLAHGCRIGRGTSTTSSETLPSGYAVVVVAGPETGSIAPLAKDRPIMVGRGAQADLQLDDPLLSLAHCTIELTSAGPIVTDLESTNGTVCEARPVLEPLLVAEGSHLEVGGSLLAIVVLDESDRAILRDLEGAQQALPRQFRGALEPLPDPGPPPAAPVDNSAGFKLAWWRALLPLVTGVGFAAITGRWIFLAIVAVSPLVMALETYRRRCARDQAEAANKRRHEAELVGYWEGLAEARRQEKVRRRSQTAGGGLAVWLARVRHRRIWERLPDHADFGDTTIAFGRLASAVSPDSSPIGETPARLWGVPLSFPLLRTGSLAVTGTRERARAAVRSMLIDLATHHSPNDIKIWLLAPNDAGPLWSFARWLPHTNWGSHASRLAACSADRAHLVRELRQLIDSRAGLAPADALAQPVHVVVVDGPELLGPAELTDLLERGTRHGVVGITIDAVLVPEGVNGTLALRDPVTGSTFESRDQPLITGLVPCELTAACAADAARCLAPLRPAAESGRDDPAPSTHLVDLLDVAGLDGAGVLRRWARQSPSTEAVVGLASGSPMVVDIAAHGPHGLVGGTSGSGKTEFLKTLFVSLCLDNHPDDLSIVIVDFKGGVDHDHSRLLPHVIDVATNLDEDRFARTVRLLDAEQRRRQNLFSSVGAANIAAYRTARDEDPSLPPLPRLLVVVDEFGELLDSDEGRQHLRNLQSITRIGRALGVHLLLVTQSFQGQLPPQVEANAALRISLRVQTPADSKVVLGSGVAASIPDHHKGRGYARFHGRDLIDFQTARVAGRRRDLTATSPPVSVRPAPFAALASLGPTSEVDDAPVEQTDMWSIIQALEEAARLAEWRGSAVPWPASLPEHVELQQLVNLGPSGDSLTVIGVADLPDQQSQAPFAISDFDEQIALVGGLSADTPRMVSNLVLASALQHSPNDLHVYLIDQLGRGLAHLIELPHCGAISVRNEARALRILRWLSAEVAARLAHPHERRPKVMLVVSGADRLVLHGEATSSPLLSPLLSLLAESAGAGVQVVLAGLPNILNHRLGMNVERRLVLHPGEAEAAVGLSRALLAELGPPGRAVDTTTGTLIQLAHESGGAAPLVRELVESYSGQRLTRPPRPFSEVPWPISWVDAPVGGSDGSIPVAIDAENGGLLSLDPEDDGPFFAVTGPRRSGRSTALMAAGRWAADAGWKVFCIASAKRSPLAGIDAPWATWVGTPIESRQGLAGAGGRTLVLIDDVQHLGDGTSLEAALAVEGQVVIAVAGPPDSLRSRTGIFRSLPAITSGLLLAPTQASQGDAIGLGRLDADLLTAPRPGCGVLGIAGEAIPARVPLVSDSIPPATRGS